MGSKSSRPSGGGSSVSSNTVVEGGGFQYTDPASGRTFTFQQRNGVAYNVSDVGSIPERFGAGFDANDLAQRARNNGRDVTILSPEQMQARVNARNADREARRNIDYELGAGVPWGNKANRQAARRGRLASRNWNRKSR